MVSVSSRALEAFGRLRPQRLGCGLLLLAGTNLVLAAACHGVSIHPYRLLFPASFAVTLLLDHWLREAREDDAPSLVYAVAYGAIVAASLLASALVLDPSFDGNWYHKEAVGLLREGWNPLYEAPPSGSSYKWLKHYPAGSWMLAASLYGITGSIEAAKAWNGLILLASLFLTVAFVRRRILLARGPAALVAVILCLNPVVVVQLSTFYADGMLASALLCLALLLIDSALAGFAPSLRTRLSLVAVVLVLVNLKFTGVAYAAMFVALYFAVMLLRARRGLVGQSFVIALAFVAGMSFVGAQPYLHNLGAHGTPFHPVPRYPLSGVTPKNHPILPEQLPRNFEGEDRFTKFFHGLFSASSNVRSYAPARLKLPGALRAEEVAVFRYPAVRVAGFGPWFGLAVVLALLAWVGIGLSRGLGWSSLVPAGLVLSSLANPEAWWARYAPQMWLFPGALACLWIVAFGARRARSLLAHAIFFVLAVDVALVAAGNLPYVWRYSQQTRAGLERLAAEDHNRIFFQGFFQGMKPNLADRRIRFEELESLQGCGERELVGRLIVCKGG